MALSITEKVLALRDAEFFSMIPDEELNSVAQIAHEVNVSMGQQFIRQGERGDCLYLIVSGEAKVVLDDVGEIAQRGPKSLIGELAILWRQPRSANCVAGTDLTLLKIDYADFWALMEAHPHLVRKAINILMTRLNERTEDVRQHGGSASG